MTMKTIQETEFNNCNQKGDTNGKCSVFVKRSAVLFDENIIECFCDIQ